MSSRKAVASRLYKAVPALDCFAPMGLAMTAGEQADMPTFFGVADKR
jgi:hypothetical protein